MYITAGWRLQRVPQLLQALPQPPQLPHRHPSCDSIHAHVRLQCKAAPPAQARAVSNLRPASPPPPPAAPGVCSTHYTAAVKPPCCERYEQLDSSEAGNAAMSQRQVLATLSAGSTLQQQRSTAPTALL